jgi:hypothetical protein
MKNVTPPRLSDEEIRTRRESQYTWYGHLADDNVEHIATRIRRLLKGQYYTVVTNNADYKYSMPEVKVSQFLVPYTRTSTGEKSDGIHVGRIGDPEVFGDTGELSKYCGINIHDSYGSYGIHSTFTNELAAREAYHSSDMNRRRWTTYITIAGGYSDDPRAVGSSDRIEITQYNLESEPCQLQWIFAPERHWDGSGPDQYKD